MRTQVGRERTVRDIDGNWDLRDAFTQRTWPGATLDVGELIAELGPSVSVVIPALDEQDTVAAVVASAVELRTAGLVDDVVVVDGGSSDATRDRAADAGARVVDQQRTLAAAGPGRGKGDALWKGVGVTSGALVVFLDADVVQPSARTIIGLVSPFVRDPGVQLVKAAYDRAFVDAATAAVAATGGGRVTELTARPLLAALWPELAWLAQPLGGEYAGRRAAFEAVPFVQGYGVEFGLLVDIAGRYGAQAIAQVDLGVRVHRHQPLAALGRMAAEILHVALSRGAPGLDPATVLPQPTRDEAGALDLGLHDIAVEERPPLAQWRAEADATHV